MLEITLIGMLCMTYYKLNTLTNTVEALNDKNHMETEEDFEELDHPEYFS